jgi:hypothetical protein
MKCIQIKDEIFRVSDASALMFNSANIGKYVDKAQWKEKGKKVLTLEESKNLFNQLKKGKK